MVNVNNTTDRLFNVQNSDNSTFRTVSTACGLISLFVFLCSSVLSSSVLWALWKTKQLQSPVYRLVAYLLIDEVLVRILGSPMIVTSLLATRWLYGDFGCLFYGFWMTWLGVTSTSLFTCISIERFIIMCRPNFKHLVTRKAADIFALGCYLHGLVWGFLPLVGVNRYVFEPSGISCTPDWSPDNFDFMLGLFSVCFLMPFVVTIVCYSAILRSVRIRIRETVTIIHHTSVEQHLAITIVLTMFAFLFAWTPYSVIGLNTTFGFEEKFPISKEVTLIPLIAAKTAGFWNPVIFTFRNKDVYAALAAKLHELKEFVCQQSNHILPEADGSVVRSSRSENNGRNSSKTKVVDIFSAHSTPEGKLVPRTATVDNYLPREITHTPVCRLSNPETTLV